MSKGKSKPKPPSKANLREQSDPKGKSDQKQAIKDSIRADVISYLRSLYMEQGIFADTMNRVLGQGGEDMKTFIKQLEQGFSDTSRKLEKTETEDSPELKKLSQEAIIESKLKDELEFNNKNTKVKKPPTQKKK